MFVEDICKESPWPGAEFGLESRPLGSPSLERVVDFTGSRGRRRNASSEGESLSSAATREAKLFRNLSLLELGTAWERVRALGSCTEEARAGESSRSKESLSRLFDVSWGIVRGAWARLACGAGKKVYFPEGFPADWVFLLVFLRIK